MPIRVAKTISHCRRELMALRSGGRTVGLVPTMGALHAGHVALLERAKKENDIAVASIFVNPTQFGPNEDFHRYPRPFGDDLVKCTTAGVDLVFHPEPGELYPADFQTYVEVHDLQKPLEGESRPTHFRGVATVVLKLLNIVCPERVYFGQKDAQQVRLVSQLVRDLDVPTDVVICPIVREPDGLAMSSRNRYLSSEDRKNASVLFRALELIRQRVEAGERDAETLIHEAKHLIQSTPGALIDYVEIADWRTLKTIDVLKGEILAAVAVHFGSTRLIDNWRVDLN